MCALIAVTGANSASGRALIARVSSSSAGSDETDSRWIACVRSERAARELGALPTNVRVAHVDYGSVDSLRAAFTGASAVVHLAGVLIERPGADYEQANVAPTRAVVEAARASGVSKLVLVSAVGADARARNRYYASKGRAEDLLRDSGLDFTILRAPMLLGPETEGEAALARELRHARVRLLRGGWCWQQPLDVDDLVRAVKRAVEPGVASRQTLDLVGSERLPYRALLTATAELAGRPLEVATLPVPVGLVRLVLRARRSLAGSGFSADALEVILDSYDIDPEPARRALGIELTPLDQTLRGTVSRLALESAKGAAA